MKKKVRNRMIAGLATAAGAAGAYFGMRRFLIWQRSQSMHNQRMTSHGYAYRGAEDNDTASGSGYTNQDMQYTGVTKPGQASTGQQSPVGAPVSGSRYQPHDQPDRQPIPTTGMAEAASLAREVTGPQHPEVSGLVDPFLRYLMSFHSMINLLRSRRQDTQNSGGNRTLSQDDRSTYQETVDQLEDQMAQYSEGDFEPNSLQGRTYRMITKLRDALRNMEYGDDDLFRINGEVRNEACKLLEELPSDPNITDLDLVRQMYECM